jgi:hypothetical protein
MKVFCTRDLVAILIALVLVLGGARLLAAPPAALEGAYLAGLQLNEPTHGPKLLKWFAKRKDCLDTTVELNRSIPELHTKEAREMGAEFVCLRIERGGV